MQWSQLKVEPGMRNQKPPAITNGRQLNFRLDRGLPTVVCLGGVPEGGVGGLCPRGVPEGVSEGCARGVVPERLWSGVP